jgi:hypothetical protein
MSQISRPFQIALLAVAVLAAAWLFVFQPHQSSTDSSSSSSAVVSSPAPQAKATGSSGPSAPGVQGLSRAIAKAHGAVATSEQNATALQRKEAQVSGGTTTPATATHPGTSVTKSSTSAHAKTKPASKSPSTPAASKPHIHSTKAIPAGQLKVERQLAHGNVVVVLFWNHNGADDEVTRQELHLLQSVHHKVAPYANRPVVKRLLKAFGLELDKKIAVNVASANQTASFGTITRGIQVYGTPTMLVIDKHGKAIVLNGLQDAFSIEQAIDEARHAA